MTWEWSWSHGGAFLDCVPSVCGSTWVFPLVAFLQRPPLQRKKDKKKRQGPFVLLLSTDLSVVIMWISFALFEKKIKRLSNGQSFEVAQAITNICFKEAWEDWILNVIGLFWDEELQECSDLAETICTYVIEAWLEMLTGLIQLHLWDKGLEIKKITLKQ